LGVEHVAKLLGLLDREGREARRRQQLHELPAVELELLELQFSRRPLGEAVLADYGERQLKLRLEDAAVVDERRPVFKKLSPFDGAVSIQVDQREELFNLLIGFCDAHKPQRRLHLRFTELACEWCASRNVAT
jgi:hypothetical protein